MSGIFVRRYDRWLMLALACTLALGVGPLALLSPVEGQAVRAHHAAAAARPAAPPTVRRLTADDQRVDHRTFMPSPQSVLRRRGVTFSDALSPYPLCCPARAQILTGQYNHNNGVMGNSWPHGGYWAFKDQRNTLPVWLKRAGYHTAFVGKYLNQYGDPPLRLHVTRQQRYAVPPGWQDWYASVDGVHAYTHVTLNVKTAKDRRPHRKFVNQYQTNFFGDTTAALIKRYHRSNKPFFIWASHLAPHVAKGPNGWRPPIPAARDKGHYAGLPLPAERAYRQSLNAAPVGKFGPMANLTPKPLTKLRREHRLRAESLLSLDRAVKQAVDTLKLTHEYKNTVIIFTSDNGYALGEHRYMGKDRPYEPELRIPMIVNAPHIKQRYSTRKPRPRLKVPDTVTITDIAATIVGVTGVRPGRPLEGIDMTRPAQNPDHGPGGDRAVLIESGPSHHKQVGTQKFVGVRTNRYTWLAWDWQKMPNNTHGPAEFYDRSKDEAQIRNLVSATSPVPAESALRDLATLMRHCKGSACVQSAP